MINKDGGFMVRVIIAGSRDFNDYALLEQKLNYALAKISEIEIVSGTARGADQLGERYAREKKLSVKRFPADWNKYGKRAGYLRNGEMAAYADACIVFWDGKSPGTKSMIDLAKQHGLDTLVINYTEE